jgi:transcriptional regulator with XRE-family HTH domain
MQRRKTAGLKKKKNMPAWAKDINDLYRVLRCATQGEFAARLRSKQGTVSTWLRGDEARKPSADTFIRMAGLAPKSDAELVSRLLRLANISDETIRSVADKLDADREKDLASEAAAGKLVSIAPLAEFNDGSMADLVLPRRCVPNAASIRYLAINKGFAFGMRWKPYLKDLQAARIEDLSKDIAEMSRQVAIEMAESKELTPPFEMGDILLVDISNSDSVDLVPFWGETILFGTGLKPQAYIIGQLGLLPRPRLGFGAVLHYWTTFEGGERYEIASWRAEMPAGASDRDDFPEVVETEAEARAWKELRLTNGERILGIVTGWLSLGTQR